MQLFGKSAENQERLRCKIYDDLILLREVIASNLYEDSTLWKEIHEKNCKRNKENL